jgi:peptidoglycan/xylan/chitin deacetylase (PgdA/CDA1 family)
MLAFLVGCSAPQEESVAQAAAPVVTTTSIIAQNAVGEPIRIALTYDDGPDEHSLDLAKYLHKQGVHATFFINGRRVGGVQSPDLRDECSAHEHPFPEGKDTTTFWREDYLEMLLDLGHRIGNHTLDHCKFTVLQGQDGGVELLEKEVILNQIILDRHIRDGVRVIRYPYGRGEGDANIAAEVNTAVSASAGLYGPVHWDLDTEDWSSSNLNPAMPHSFHSPQAAGATLKTAIVDRIAAGTTRMIVLHHDRLEFNAGSTYAWDLAREIVPWMQASPQGYALTALEGVVAPGALPPRTNTVPALAESRCWSQSHANGSTPDCQDGLAGHPDWSASPSYYRTLQIADINSDGDGDVCGRRDDGIYCAYSSGADLDPLTRVYGGDFTDAMGWYPAQYGTTVQLVDINGDSKVDICGRGGGGVVCALQQTDGTFGSGPATLITTAFSDSDANGAFSASEAYYASIHFAHVNGDGLVDICGRGYGGIRCSIASKDANGAVTFGPSTAWITTEFSDRTGWQPSRYGSTVQFADVDGDGKADVCGRGVHGIVCALSSGTGFVSPSLWTPGGEFSDGGGWAAERYYRSIRLADVNGDGKADACGRGGGGVVCALSRAIAGVATGFAEPAIVMLGDFNDGSFDPANLVADSSTLRFGELNHGPLGGRKLLDVCIHRSGTGLFCAVNKLDDVDLD